MTTIIQQKQETKVQRFVLVGPHLGKTLNVNGHPFVDGEYTFQGPAHQVDSLAKIFKRYAALPVEDAKAYQLEYLKANGSSEEQDAVAQYEAQQQQQQQQQDSQKADQSEAQASDQPAADRPVTPAAAQPAADQSDMPAADPQDGPAQKLTLAEAIGSLDTEVDDHWTSNNLPAIDTLADLTGKAVTRAEVNEVAEGYTRAKARAAKQ